MSLNKTNIAPCPEEVLKGLDLIVVIDHSGSTETGSTRLKGKSRYDEMQEQAVMAAEVMSRYDDDGITLVHFSNHAVTKDGVNADAVRELFKEVRPGGGTVLSNAINEVVKKTRTTSKEVVALIFTDGEANDPDEVKRAMDAAGKEFGRPKIGFCFIQVGNDPGAKSFLDMLDNDLKVDISATFSNEDAEGLSIQQLIQAARTE